jgi:D-sedoheptulose 7-phosphate isomerase
VTESAEYALMVERTANELAEHVALANRMEQLLPQVGEIADRLIAVFGAGGRLFSFGNGGSAADAQHLAAELVGRYARERRPLAATALTVDPSTVTAIGNDFSFEDVFARQVRGLVRPGDAVVAFTTSGRAPNVVNGLVAAREHGAVTVVFTGGEGGPVVDQADHALVVPSTTTARIQEMHLLLLHLIVERIDRWAAG